MIDHSNQLVTQCISIKLHLTKIIYTGGTEPANLTPAQLGSIIYDTVQIDPDTIEGIDSDTGRHDTRELLLKSGTEVSTLLTIPGGDPYKAHGHET